MEKMMILTSSYRYGEELRQMIDWGSIGIEVVSVEYNGAIGLEQFAFFKPRIVLLDSTVPIIGTDSFVQEMSNVSSDFLVMLIDDLRTPISNIQNIYRVIDRSEIEPDTLRGDVLAAVEVLNKKLDWENEFDEGERLLTLRETLGSGNFTIANLQELRNRIGLDLLPQINILLPRPSARLSEPYTRNVLEAIKNILDEKNGGEVLVMDDGVLCIIINEIHGSSTERDYENFLFDIRRLLMNEYSVKWTFILSNPIPLRRLEKEYAVYRDLYEYGYFRSELTILKREFIFTKSLPKKNKRIQTYYGMLVNATISDDVQELLDVFQLLYDDYLKQAMSREELFHWRHTLELIYCSICFLYDLSDVSELSPVFGRSYHIIEEEREAICREFLVLQSRLQSRPPKNGLIYQVITILIEQYRGDVSLQMVAKEINITTTYLSHLFKKEMRITFSEYLTLLRIVAAKRMLFEGTHKIHEIATAVGLIDNRYFGRVFKKVTGMTPSEYGIMLRDRSKEQDI